ncbi:Collagen alpha-4(VI) chain [Bulinus truncatus]|nr:Collagen alpha-4(VI) chain [Bulinus truncatus]
MFRFLLLMIVAKLANSSPIYKPCGKPADVIFVIDSSSSIWPEDFKHRLLPFIQNVVSTFDIGPDPSQTRVGAVTYSTDVRLEFNLNTYNRKDRLLNAVSSIRFRGGDTYTDKALKYVSDNMFDSRNGGRDGVAHIIIVLTDGRSTNNKRTVNEAAIARQKGAAIFAIGVGQADNSELIKIASQPEAQFKFKVTDYAALDSIKVELAIKTCEECGGKPADVFFILDSSSSIWKQDFDKRMLGFVRDVVANFDISPKLTRVGFMTFSDSPKLVFNLDAYSRKRELMDAISPSVIKYSLGGTNTAEALRDVRKFGFLVAPRDGVTKIAVVITDGQSWDEKETRKQATLLKDYGVMVYAIGVGKSVKDDELEAIASSPREEFVFNVDDFSALSQLRDILAIKACGNDQSQDDQPVCGSGAIDVTVAFDANTMSIQDKHRTLEQIKTITERLEYVGGEVRLGVTSGNCAESMDVPMSPPEVINKKLRHIKKTVKPSLHKIIKDWSAKQVVLQQDSIKNQLEGYLPRIVDDPRKALVLLLNGDHTTEFAYLAEEVLTLMENGVEVFVLLDKTVRSSYVNSWNSILGKRRVISHVDPDHDFSGYIMEFMCAL